MEREFWHDDNFPYFLVTWKPYDLPESSSQVAWFTEGFTRYYTDHLLNGAGMLRLHEYLYRWSRALLSFANSTDALCILAAIDHYNSPPSRHQFEEAVQNGGDLSMPPDAFGSCAQLSIDKLFLFDLGFDLTASMKAHAVTGVRPDGPAFRAGLRDGLPLTGWSVYNDQPDKETRFDIRVDGAKKSIRYYPR